MKYKKKVENSLKENIIKKQEEKLKYKKNKSDHSYSSYNAQHRSRSEESSSAKKYGIVRSSAGVYTFHDNEEIWCVKRIKEGQGPVVEILCRKYGDYSAPWFGIRIEETELGYVPTCVYLDGKSIPIDSGIYPCQPGGYQDIQEIYKEVSKSIEKACKRNAIDMDADKILFFILEGKKYLLKHIDETLKHDPELSPEERKTKMKDWEDLVWFLESRLLR